MPLTELIKFGVHGVKHADDFHWWNLTANWRKANYVTEQNRHIVEHLGKKENDIFLFLPKNGLCNSVRERTENKRLMIISISVTFILQYVV